MELYFKYSEQVDQVDEEDADEESEDKDEEIYLKKLEMGLFALQSIVYIILDITVNGPPSVSIETHYYYPLENKEIILCDSVYKIRKRVEKLLNLRRVQKEKLIQIIRGMF